MVFICFDAGSIMARGLDKIQAQQKNAAKQAAKKKQEAKKGAVSL